MKKYNDTVYWGDVVFYSCDNNGTATYRTSDPAGGVDAEFNSPDCPALTTARFVLSTGGVERALTISNVSYDYLYNKIPRVTSGYFALIRV